MKLLKAFTLASALLVTGINSNLLKNRPVWASSDPAGTNIRVTDGIRRFA